MKLNQLFQILFAIFLNFFSQSTAVAISSNSSKKVLIEKTDKLLLPASEEGKFACIANCEEKVARVEKEETINSYIFSDTIRICGPAANEKTAQWMQKTINEGWSAPDIYYKGKNMIVDVKVIYDQNIECSKHFDVKNILELEKNENNPSVTVMRVFHNDLINKPIQRHDDFEFAMSIKKRATGTLGYAALCGNYSEISLVPKHIHLHSEHMNTGVLLHEFGHLLCLSDKYNKTSNMFYENDIMNNKFINNINLKIQISKQNIVDVISRFECYRENLSNRNILTDIKCEKQSPYNKFDICLEKESNSLAKWLNNKCLQDKECLKKEILPNIEIFKSNILKTCNKFLPNI